MANEVLQKQGTSVTWTSAGGDETLNMASLGAGDGRQGDEHDFGETFPLRVRVMFEFDPNVAPTALSPVNVYWSSSHDGTDYDGECTGSDGAYNDEDDMRRLHYVGTLACTNDTDPHRASWVFMLPARYGLPVVSNKSGQAFTATGTDHKVVVTPLIDEIQD